VDLPHTCTIDLGPIDLIGISEGVRSRLYMATGSDISPKVTYLKAFYDVHNEDKSYNACLSKLFKVAEENEIPLNNLTTETLDKDNLRWVLHLLFLIGDDEENKPVQVFFAKKLLECLKFANEDKNFHKWLSYEIGKFDRKWDDSDYINGRHELIVPFVLDLEIEYRLSKLPQTALINTKALADLLVGGWTIAFLDKQVQAITQTHPFFDKFEVYMGYFVKLKGELSFPIDFEEVSNFQCHALTKGDLNNAKFMFQQTLTGEKRLEFLIKDQLWKEALRLKFPNEMQEIENAYFTRYGGSYPEIDEDLYKIDAETKEAWVKAMMALSEIAQNQS